MVLTNHQQKSPPAGTEKLNLEAFDRGFDYFDGVVTRPVLELHRPPLEGAPA